MAKEMRKRGAHDQLLNDPIVRLVMKADNVDQADLEKLLATTAWKLSVRRGGPAQAADDAASESGIAGQYRLGVGIMLLNERNEVLVGRRIGAEGKAWQMPQGGIDADETPRTAAFRELKEEIGTGNAEILAESEDWLAYDLPAALVAEARHPGFRGQKHKWFVMRFTGEAGDIDVATEHPEFSEWKWVAATELPEIVIAFKRQLYLDLLGAFGEAHLRHAG